MSLNFVELVLTIGEKPLLPLVGWLVCVHSGKSRVVDVGNAFIVNGIDNSIGVCREERMMLSGSTPASHLVVRERVREHCCTLSTGSE